MPHSNTNNQAQANDAAGQSQFQTAANANAAKKAEKKALKAANMRDWVNNRDDHLPHFLSYGGTADRANAPK